MSGRRLEGKTALITGTGGGQGRAAALLFAREGATVVGCDLKAEAEETVRLVRSEGGSMTSTSPVDLGDPAQTKGWIQDAAEEHGGFDILYNNASIARFAPVADMSDDAWNDTLRNELDLVFYACRAAWPYLTERGGGSIINIASIQGMRALPAAGGSGGGFAHATTKAGVIAMTRELALEGGQYGIRVNSISPGLIDTPAVAEMMAIDEVVSAFIDRQILRRVGQPEDVARAALFLASADAGWITGINLPVDGGYTAC
jgi:meso-butanediol dehydrogenase / (S,S)-butanediol dehydrogenase / diacetyl reductase